MIHRWRLVGAGTLKSRHIACARVKSAMRALPAGCGGVWPGERVSRQSRVGPSGGARAQALQANRQAGRHRRARARTARSVWPGTREPGRRARSAPPPRSPPSARTITIHCGDPAATRNGSAPPRPCTSVARVTASPPKPPRARARPAPCQIPAASAKCQLQLRFDPVRGRKQTNPEMRARRPRRW